MRELGGKVAVVTGGGGLLGSAMARAFAAEGMDVVVADLDLAKAEAVAEQVAAAGRRGLAVACDVADLASVAALADRAYDDLGAVHLVCNNAGLAVVKPFAELSMDDWQRVLGVQWWGVLHGVTTFLPRLLAQGGEAHIVNTASMSGVGLAELRHRNAPYVTAKFAVVGMTECLAASLEGGPVGASVLCPGFTVADPAAVPEQVFAMASAEWYRDELLDGDQVATEVVRGIKERRLHIFPHRRGRAEVEARHDLLMRSFDQAGVAAT